MEVGKRFCYLQEGVRYETFRDTLTKYPKTLLGAMFSPKNKSLLVKDEANEYFIDRNGKIFAPILDFYRHGEIIVPPDLSRYMVQKEMDYFQIPIPKDFDEPEDSGEEYIILRISQEYYAKEAKHYQCLYQTTGNNLSKLLGKVQGSWNSEGMEGIQQVYALMQVLKQQLIHNHINQLSLKGYSLLTVTDKGNTVYMKRRKSGLRESLIVDS